MNVGVARAMTMIRNNSSRNNMGASWNAAYNESSPINNNLGFNNSLPRPWPTPKDQKL